MIVGVAARRARRRGRHAPFGNKLAVIGRIINSPHAGGTLGNKLFVKSAAEGKLEEPQSPTPIAAEDPEVWIEIAMTRQADLAR